MAVLNKEWNAIPLYELSNQLKYENNAETFCHELERIVDEKNVKIFENISRFAKRIMSLPNSNAPSERIWSVLTDNLKKNRNCLNFENLRAILLTTQYVSDTGGLTKFKPTPTMFDRLLKNYNDKIQKNKKFGDVNMYKTTEIKDEHIISCLDDIIYVDQLNKKMDSFFNDLQISDHHLVELNETIVSNFTEKCLENSTLLLKNTSAIDVLNNANVKRPYKSSLRIPDCDDIQKKRKKVHKHTNNNAIVQPHYMYELRKLLNNGLIDCY